MYLNIYIYIYIYLTGPVLPLYDLRDPVLPLPVTLHQNDLAFALQKDKRTIQEESHAPFPPEFCDSMP